MSLVLSSALLASGLFSLAEGYTQVNIPSPFMYKNIDPIVFPDEYGKSHLHSFYGSDAVTIHTKKSEKLREGCTAAENINDLSSYWTPTLLYQNGGDSWEPVPVMRFSAYYGLGDNGPEIPFPENFKMVTGDAQAQTVDAMPSEIGSEWFCEGDEAGLLGANGFPTTTCSTHLQQILYFPQCVDTETLEYAYKDGEPGSYHSCPEGMQAVPQLRFSIRYDLRDVLPSGWSGEAPLQLACGNAYCSHGDFINGWTVEGGEALVQASSDKHEFQDLVGQGETMGCEPADADPEHGKSTYAESAALIAKREVSEWGWTSRSRTARL